MAGRVVPFAKPASRPPRGAIERAFLPAALEIVETPASPTARLTVAWICLFLVTAIAWSWFGKVDIVATAPGKIVVAGRSKVIQPFQEGVVRTIAIRDGERVKAGEVLITLDPTISAADRERSAALLIHSRLDEARLQTLIAGDVTDRIAAVKAPAGLAAAAEAELAAERSEQAAKIASLQRKIAEAEARKAEIQAEIAKIGAELPFAEARRTIRAAGVKTGFGNELDLMQQGQEVAALTNERIAQSREEQAADAAIAELKTEVTEATAEFRSKLLNELGQVERQAANAAAELAKATRLTGLQTLIAPVSGVVQDLSVHTIGAVVTPGQQLLELVPTGAPIEMVAVIANRDIGFVHPGQKAEVKIDSFPFTLYGLIHGTVRSITPDSESPLPMARQPGSAVGSDNPADLEHAQRLVYVAHIALDQTSLTVNGRAVALHPGMSGEAEIKTGRRRVLDYLLSPLRRYGHDALRER